MLEIPASWKEARLTIFPKKGKDASHPDPYRSISILNVDYKILATILANRLNKIIAMYIHPDQTRFIKDRNLKSNIRRTLNIVKQEWIR